MKDEAVKLDAVVEGGIAWDRAGVAAWMMADQIRGEIKDLENLLTVKDAYSPVAWVALCQHLRTAVHGMMVMRRLALGQTNDQIIAETGISNGSIAAYKAWNTMYLRHITAKAERRIRIKGRTEAERNADIEFLRSCGITFSVVPATTQESILD